MPFRYVTRREQVIRTFCSGIGKTAVIYPAAFLQNLGLLILILGAIFYVREVHGISKAMLGIFCALFTVGYGVGCITVRPLTDHIRPRYLLIVSAVSCAGLALLFHFGHSFLIAGICYALIGFLGFLFWPPIVGWLAADLERADLGRAMSRYNVFMSVAGMAGAPLAGWLSRQNPALPILVSAGIMFFNAVMIVGATLALPTIRNDRYTASSSVAPPSKAGGRHSTRLRYAAWVGLFTAFAASAVVGNIFPIAAKEDFHITKPVIGLLLMLSAIATTAVFYLMGRTSFWHYRSSQMLAGQACLVAAMIALTHAGQPWTIALLMLLLGSATALSYLNSQFHGLAGSANRASRSAVHEALFSGGLVCGALGGGFLYEKYSMAAAFQACAALLIVGMICQAAIAVWTRRIEVSVRSEISPEVE